MADKKTESIYDLSIEEILDRDLHEYIFDDFRSKMLEKYNDNLKQKGHSWRSNEDVEGLYLFLYEELVRHVGKKDFVDAANFCLMLKYFNKTWLR